MVFIVGRSNQQVVLIAEIDFNKTFSPPFSWLTFACTSPVVAPVASTSSATLPWSPHPSIVTSPLILWPHTWSTLTPVTCKNNHNLTLALETKKVILSKHVCQGVNAKEFYVQLSKEGRQNHFTFKLRFGTARIERNLRTTCKYHFSKQSQKMKSQNCIISNSSFQSKHFTKMQSKCFSNAPFLLILSFMARSLYFQRKARTSMAMIES